MTTLNLDELERLLAEAQPLPWIWARTPYGPLPDAEVAVTNAAINALPELLAAARERDDLIASNGILRQQAVALAEERDALKAECERYQKALEYIASTGDPGFEVDDKTWWVWGENMRMKARTALVKP